MGNKTIVIALGGNALGKTASEQLSLVEKTAKPIADLIESGNRVVIAHGNGPQVGLINLGLSSIEGGMPFPECVAMSQGYIGYHLQNAIQNELHCRKIEKDVVTVVTRIKIDSDDEAFKDPTKPIGLYYDKDEAEQLSLSKGYIMKNFPPKGFRQVVPSPKPVDVIEKNTIKALIDAGDVVITVGGGGIPVAEQNNRLVGISAIIDKDFASEKLAELVDADMLIILTAVEKVSVNYGKPNEEKLSFLTVDQAEKLAEEGQFGKGSMLPKVQAAIQFAKSKVGRTCLITSLEKALDGINGKTGTLVKTE